MNTNIYSVITGTGSYIPSRVITNEDFLTNEFFETNGEKLNKPNQEITEKFLEITTIAQRRYITDDLTTSDMAFFAAEQAIKSSNIDKEELDYIIVANNFGDTKVDNRASDHVPAMASKVKHKLQIKNPDTVVYDLTFGCPGWVQGVIQADYFIKSGDAKKILVIGAEVLSRISDPHDRDCMLYADGAGAVVLEAKESTTPIGILTHKTRSDTFSHAGLLHMGPSYNPEYEKPNDLFLKMNGRRLYQYALETVPPAIKACLDKINMPITEVSKVLIHQANGKMDDAMLKRLYALYNIDEAPENVMPMTVHELGNTSVATLPTLLDLILKENLANHSIGSGDVLVFASVGAGMNINAFIYKMA
ncbi:Beta-ketoacyl-acyl-carrier-protein synthase III [Paludibacter propionicigenes WB4]|uniref:Beta-ketoacyl-acyl-carrier-protein synthase III n=1 Tax=Paludibacter propionicigenes (strain DSM 17365 / JCM 13257 / WB4) TaxID=694427 RepID=E4T5I7_PALPW|nr:ketoacyl-ACP synthase III [Paludibacter propionicigenes]ADQ79981.1 Beta-ketoacyl-acyl-carrier-protein synthase III [Paludibacter propionicigenes WB4]